MPALTFDRFYRYDDLTAILKDLEAAHPELLKVEAMGQSYEGRDIWLATVTNTATGPADEKPGFWVEAQIHATELTGSTAALHLIHRLVTGYGDDETITRCLDTRVMYVVPRLNPDGAELALADRPRHIRSSTRPWPRMDQQDGLMEEDVDGDGRILAMRIPDPNGTWKPYAEDPRLLVARDPEDEGGLGPYYRLLPEGTIKNYDGVTIAPAPNVEGLDLNRNWPADWRTEGEQKGAGPFPTSEPEIRAAVQAMIDRPNICGYISYHTFSGVHLRPYDNHPDDHFPTNDLRIFKEIGKKATSITGYPAVSVYHDFRYDPKDVITGGSDTWAYDHLGVFAWTTEFWAPPKQAGIEEYKFIDWWDDHPLEDDLKLLEWSDGQLAGKGYVDWYEFDHPQLGKVELGGWDFSYAFRNPPPDRLEEEIRPHADWAIWHCLISPRLALHSTEVERLGDGAWRVRVVVQNTGWLPTNVTEKAVERKHVRGVEAKLIRPEGSSEDDIVIVGGKELLDLGQLAGRALKTSTIGWGTDDTGDRAKAEWIVRAPGGTTLKVEVRHQRAGVVRCEVGLTS